ncbi:MAG: hypothetical protein P4L16_04765 [Chlamydiales bacterium]|nr:hypothetical protein [Chlamydiales bacterium]
MQKKTLFKVIAWSGLAISLFSRFALGTPWNPYLLFIGAPLVIIGLTGLIIYWKANSVDHA